MAALTPTWTWIDGEWRDGNTPLFGARTHAVWLGSTVFDGARAFEGVTPDLDLHCARLNASALALGLKPVMAAEAMVELAQEGLKKFGPDPSLYIRPMYWAEEGGYFSVPPDPESTRFALVMHETPMPEPTGTSVMLSRFRRPTWECAPVDAKAACLYPNNGRALIEAKQAGFDNAVLCDMLGNVAELATANIFMARDGVVLTPVANGTFLAGITRARVMGLLRADGIEVIETTLGWKDFLAADEVFQSGNYGKVLPITRVGDRTLQPGPFYRRARELYWDFAHG